MQNNRVDELLLNIDKYFGDLYFDKIIKDGEKLPNKINLSLEKYIYNEKEENNNNNDNKDDIQLINKCIEI